MAGVEIPSYTPSGAGQMTDLKNILISDILAFGAYKGKLKRTYKAVVGGTEIVNGVEVFKDFPPLDWQANYGDWGEFLELLGYSEEDRIEMINSYNQPGVDHLYFYWQESFSYNEAEFKEAYDELLAELSEVKTAEILNETIRYNEAVYAETERVAVRISDYFTDMARESDVTGFKYDQGLEEVWDAPSDPEVTGEDIQRTLRSTLFHQTSIVLLNEHGTDITDRYDDEIVDALKVMLLISSENFGTYVESVKLYEEEYEANKNTYQSVHSKDVYDIDVNSSFKDNEYDNYKADNGSDDPTIEYYEAKLYSHFWLGRDKVHQVPPQELTPNGFFLWNYGYSGQMSTRALAQAQREELNEIIILWSNLRLTAKSNKWYVRIILSVVRVIAKILGDLLDIFNRIPFVRLQIEAFMFVYTRLTGATRAQAYEIVTRLEKLALSIAVTIGTGGTGAAGLGVSSAEATAAAVEAGTIAAGETVAGTGLIGLAEGSIALASVAGVEAVISSASFLINSYVELSNLFTEGLPESETVNQEEEEVLDPEENTIGSVFQQKKLQNTAFNQMFNPLDQLTLGSNVFDNGNEFDIQAKIDKGY